MMARRREASSSAREGEGGAGLELNTTLALSESCWPRDSDFLVSYSHPLTFLVLSCRGFLPFCLLPYIVITLLGYLLLPESR